MRIQFLVGWEHFIFLAMNYVLDNELSVLFLGMYASTGNTVRSAFKWYHHRVSVSYMNWAVDDQTVSSQENCVVMDRKQNWKWTTIKCTAVEGFLCDLPGMFNGVP